MALMQKNNILKLFIKRICNKIYREIIYNAEYLYYSFFTSYSKSENFKINNIFQFKNEYETIPTEVVNNYLEHNFELLGSGWINVNLQKAQIINASNRKYSNTVKKLISNKYHYIDWHTDFKSNHTWNVSKFSKKIKLKYNKGFDIKIPWELSRLQHLPQLALYYNNIKSDEEKSVIIDEFRNQVLDFIYSNPVRYGVNWICTMDVSIRCTNLLLAYDIFINNNYEFDNEFNTIFYNSIIDHYNFIIKNLEWNKSYQGNHYLSNICGLIWACCYLERNFNFENYLIFGIQELKNSLIVQFFDDGTNKEGSTYYHRLCSEMILWTTAILLNLPQSRFNNMRNLKYSKLNLRFGPEFSIDTKLHLNKSTTIYDFLGDQFFKKLQDSINFIEVLMNKKYEIPQIGDNDSGRFIKTKPIFLLKNNIYKENNLDVTFIFNISDYLYNSTFTNINSIDYNLIQSLKINKINVNKSKSQLFLKDNLDNLDNFYFLYNQVEDKKKKRYNFLFTNIKNDNITYNSFTNFGIYVYKTNNFNFTVRCGNDYDGQGSHYHNDQLSITLHDNTEYLIEDPGSYLYTSNLKIRNKYRSVSLHHTPQCNNIEPENLNNGEFKLNKTTFSEILYVNEYNFLAKYYGSNFLFYRLINISTKKIEILDISLKENLVDLTYFKPQVSKGYGTLEN
jgi:hypothetical protein